jgi:membrane-associated phospholipid phosphatase
MSRHAGARANRLKASAAASWQEPARRRLGLALAVALLAAITFARVAEDYLTNDPLARWDVSFARWLAGERTTAGIDFFRLVTFFGSAVCLIAVTAVIFIVLVRRGRRVQAALLPLVLVGAELLNLILKLSFHRARPEVAFIHLDTYSFPSGHAMVSTAVYGALAYLAWPRVRTRRGRAVLVAGTILFVGLICFSRLYLGVHYLSDVLAGAAGGVFCLGISIAVVTLYQVRSTPTPPLAG